MKLKIYSLLLLLVWPLSVSAQGAVIEFDVGGGKQLRICGFGTIQELEFRHTFLIVKMQFMPNQHNYQSGVPPTWSGFLKDRVGAMFVHPDRGRIVINTTGLSGQIAPEDKELGSIFSSLLNAFVLNAPIRLGAVGTGDNPGNCYDLAPKYRIRICGQPGGDNCLHAPE